MASLHARLIPMQVLGPTRMVTRSMPGARAGVPARLMSVTYGRSSIIRLYDGETRPIAAYSCSSIVGAAPSTLIYTQQKS